MVCIQGVVALDSLDVRIRSRCLQMCGFLLEHTLTALYQLLKQNTDECQKNFSKKISVKIPNIPNGLIWGSIVTFLYAPISNTYNRFKFRDYFCKQHIVLNHVFFQYKSPGG